MRYKMTFAVGFAAGYTLGAKAGRERYEQISRFMRGMAENPAVQSAAGVLQAQASTLVDTAKHKVVDRLPVGHGTGSRYGGGSGGYGGSGSDPYGPGPVPTGHGNGSTPQGAGPT